MQPSSKDDRRNPYARPSAWGVAPAPVFRIGPLPKALATPPPRPARPAGSGILSGAALPMGPAQPRPAPQPEIKPAPVPEPEVQPAPAFVAPPRPEAVKPAKSRLPLFAGAGLAAVLVGGLAIGLMSRETPAPSATPTPPAPTETITTPEPAAIAEPVQQVAVAEPAARVDPAPARTEPRAEPVRTAALPEGPVPYAPQGTVQPQPQAVAPEPAPIVLPPPTPVVIRPIDPNAPQVTRDPTLGD